MQLILVKDIMEKSVVTVSENKTIKEVAEILHKGGFSGCPVVNEQLRVIGVISEKDIFRSLYPSYDDYYRDVSIPTMGPSEMEAWLRESGSKKIKEILSGPPITTTPNTPLVKVGAIMLARNIHRLPVVDNDKLVGIITRRQLYRSLFNHLFKFKNTIK